MLPDEVREAVDALYQRANESGVFFYMPTNAEARDTIRAHLLAREAEVERHVKMLADCFRMAGADTDGNEDWRIAPDALRAVTDLRRDYDDVLDWQARAERAEALLREAVALLHPDTDEHKRFIATYGTDDELLARQAARVSP